MEQLRSIPKDYRTSRAIQWSDDGRETGHQFIPVGFMMHRAADEIERLKAAASPGEAEERAVLAGDRAIKANYERHQLERDAARLDDMERTKCYPFWNGTCWTYIVAAERSSKIERKGIGATVREAIDAAMRSDVSEEKP